MNRRSWRPGTGGVPLLVRELLRAIAEQGIRPTASASPLVAAFAPRAVSQWVVLRLGRLSAAARPLARAASVLGEADLRLAASLADGGSDGAATEVDELAAVGILEEGRPLRFVHPIVRAAVEADLSPGERAALHAAAARALADEGATADRVAAHLFATEPGGNDGSRFIVRGRQDRDRRRGSRFSRRVSAAGVGRAAARVRLPRSAARAWLCPSYADEPEATAHLEAALETATEARAQVTIARDLPIPKTPPEQVAKGIFNGIEAGEEEIFPGPLAQTLVERWHAGPVREFEAQNAGLVQPVAPAG